MCGIAGCFAPELAHSEVELVTAIVHDQIRRGPDVQAVESIGGANSCAVLGHDRLRIIDLSAAANQPMTDHRFALTYNGEIYNYLELRTELVALGRLFHTQSDTEVILHAFHQWGDAAIERFNGMFVFALFDRQQDRLLLVRDRFGVKPLFYSRDTSTIVFASSARAIARRLGKSPNLDYAARAIQFNFCDFGDQSPYEGIKAVEPGSLLDCRLDANGNLNVGTQKYYDLDNIIAGRVDSLAAKPLETVLNELTETLANAVDIRFRADVPVAVSLSGGLDSSSVAAMSAAREQGEVLGFTFGHPDDAWSEGPVTAQLASKLGLKVRWINPGMEEIVNAFFTTLDAQEAPYPSGSVIAQHLVYKDVQTTGVRVLLGGQGGDEAFMGYRKFQLFNMQKLMHARRFDQALVFGWSLIPAAVSEIPRLKSYTAGYRRRRERRQIALQLPDCVAGVPPVRVDEPLWKSQTRDVSFASLPMLLRFEDRNSMYFSIESRLPFMDYRVVELGIALPHALKLRGGYGKWILREAMAGRIPETIRRARYKRGFDVRQDAWIDRGLGAAIRGALNEQCSRIQSFLRPAIDTDLHFSDARLKQDVRAFAEATSLLWLAH